MNQADVIILYEKGYLNKENNFISEITKTLENMSRTYELHNIEEVIDKKLGNKPIIIIGENKELNFEEDWVKKTINFVNKKIEKNYEKPYSSRTPILGIGVGAILLAEGFEVGSTEYRGESKNCVVKIHIEDMDKIFYTHPDTFYKNLDNIHNINNMGIRNLAHSIIDSEWVMQAFEIPETSCYGIQFIPQTTEEERIKIQENYKNKDNTEIEIITETPKENIINNFISRCNRETTRKKKTKKVHKII